MEFTLAAMCSLMGIMSSNKEKPFCAISRFLVARLKELALMESSCIFIPFI